VASGSRDTRDANARSKRISGRRVQQPHPDRRRQAGRVRVQQRGRRVVVKAPQRHLKQPGLIERPRVAIANRGQHDDRLGLQTPRHERQDISAGPVQPMGVLDQQQHRHLRCGLRHHVQRGKRNQEQVRCGGVRHAERREHGVALWCRQLLPQRQDRPQQLMQPREGQLRLGLDTRRGEDPHPLVCRHPAYLCQQRRLPDPGLAAHNDRGTPITDVVNQLGQPLRLGTPPEQRGSRHSRRHGAPPPPLSRNTTNSRGVRDDDTPPPSDVKVTNRALRINAD
jgi:hypothetical protein